jgi:hypothetical protein
MTADAGLFDAAASDGSAPGSAGQIPFDVLPPADRLP